MYGSAGAPAFAAPVVNPFDLTGVPQSCIPDVADFDSDGDLDIMVGEFGEVLVVDWGLALSFRAQAEGQDPRETLGPAGTPAYMAPEMAKGQAAAIGPATDVYLLGATLFEIVTGDVPHPGATVMDCLLAAAQNDIRAVKKSAGTAVRRSGAIAQWWYPKVWGEQSWCFVVRNPIAMARIRECLAVGYSSSRSLLPAHVIPFRWPDYRCDSDQLLHDHGLSPWVTRRSPQP